MDLIVSGGGGAPSYAYTGEPDLRDYLKANQASKVSLAHLVKPSAEREIPSERSLARTFPGRFHQTVRMPLEESYLAVHRSEDKRHGLRPSQCLVFFPDLIEVHLPGAPSLVKIRDARTVELGFSFSQNHEVCAG